MKIVSEKQMRSKIGLIQQDKFKDLKQNYSTNQTPKLQLVQENTKKEEEKEQNNKQLEEDKSTKQTQLQQPIGSNNSPTTTSHRKQTFVGHTGLHRPTKLFFNNTRRSIGGFSADDDYQYDEEDIELIFIIKKRIFQSFYRQVQLKYIPDDTIATIYHQTKQQFVIKGIYDGFMNIKQAALLAAYIMYASNHAKIMRSKDNKLTDQQIKMQLASCLPRNLLEKNKTQQWVQNIGRVFEHQMQRISSPIDAMAKILQLVSKYDIAYGTYYSLMLVEQSRNFVRFPLNLFVSINSNGVLFMDDLKRNSIIAKFRFQEILYVYGIEQALKFGTLLINEDTNANFRTGINFDADDNNKEAQKYELIHFEFKCKRAREFTQDIISYCQLEIIQSTPFKSNKYIEPFDLAYFSEMYLKKPYGQQLNKFDVGNNLGGEGMGTALVSQHRTQPSENSDELDFYVPKFNKLIQQQQQSKGLRRQQSSQARLFKGIFDNVDDPNAAPSAIDEKFLLQTDNNQKFQSINEPSGKRRISQFYVFKPQSNYLLAFRRGYPLIRRVETHLTKRAYRNLQEAQIVNAIANFDPSKALTSSDGNQESQIMTTPIQSFPGSQIQTPSGQYHPNLTSFHTDIASPPLQGSPSFGKLQSVVSSGKQIHPDPDKITQKLNQVEKQNQQESPQLQILSKKSTSEFANEYIDGQQDKQENDEENNDLNSKKNEPMRNNSGRGKNESSSGNLIKSSSSALEILVQQAGEQESETKSRASKKEQHQYLDIDFKTQKRPSDASSITDWNSELNAEIAKRKTVKKMELEMAGLPIKQQDYYQEKNKDQEEQQRRRLQYSKNIQIATYPQEQKIQIIGK